MDISIVPAQSEDLEIILQRQKECYQSEAELYNDYTIAPLTQDLASITEEYHRGVLILKGVYQGQIIGSVRGYSRDGSGYIGRLIVKPTFQNQKLGQSLMHAIEERLSTCHRYELFTGHKSQKNLYLYQKLGYQEFRRQPVSEQLSIVYLEKYKHREE